MPLAMRMSPVVRVLRGVMVVPSGHIVPDGMVVPGVCVVPSGVLVCPRVFGQITMAVMITMVTIAMTHADRLDIDMEIRE